MRFLKQVPGLMLAPAVVGSMALLLYLVGTVPAYLQRLPENEYATIDSAEAALGFEVVMPVYFPSYLAWPPARIWAKSAPVPMVQTVFRSASGLTETLLIYQVASTDEGLLARLPWIDTETERGRVPVNDGEGDLVVGKRADGQVVNAVRWRMNGFQFAVVTTRPVRELLLLARSMHLRGA